MVDRLVGAGLPPAKAGALARWEGARMALRREIGASDWRVWIEPLQAALDEERGEISVRCPNGHFLGWVVEHHAARFVELVRAPVRFTVARVDSS